VGGRAAPRLTAIPALHCKRPCARPGRARRASVPPCVAATRRGPGGMAGEAGKDPFDVLGVRPTATDDEVKAAYRELAKRHHPDVSKADDAALRFKEASEAFAVRAWVPPAGARAGRRSPDDRGQRSPPPQAVKRMSKTQREARERRERFGGGQSTRDHMRSRMEAQAAKVSEQTRGEAGAARGRRRSSLGGVRAPPGDRGVGRAAGRAARRLAGYLGPKAAVWGREQLSGG